MSSSGHGPAGSPSKDGPKASEVKDKNKDPKAPSVASLGPGQRQQAMFDEAKNQHLQRLLDKSKGREKLRQRLQQSAIPQMVGIEHPQFKYAKIAYHAIALADAQTPDQRNKTCTFLWDGVLRIEKNLTRRENPNDFQDIPDMPIWSFEYLLGQLSLLKVGLDKARMEGDNYIAKEQGKEYWNSNQEQVLRAIQLKYEHIDVRIHSQAALSGHGHRRTVAVDLKPLLEAGEKAEALRHEAEKRQSGLLAQAERLHAQAERDQVVANVLTDVMRLVFDTVDYQPRNAGKDD